MGATLSDKPVDTERLDALYQFVIMIRVLAAGGITSMITSLLMGRRGNTEAEQLRRFPANGE